MKIMPENSVSMNSLIVGVYGLTYAKLVDQVIFIG